MANISNTVPISPPHDSETTLCNLSHNGRKHLSDGVGEALRCRVDIEQQRSTINLNQTLPESGPTSRCCCCGVVWLEHHVGDMTDEGNGIMEPEGVCRGELYTCHADTVAKHHGASETKAFYRTKKTKK